MEAQKLDILGVEIAKIAKKDVVGLIDSAVRKNGKLQICTVNNEFILEARKNNAFRDVLNASLSIADSSGVAWAASFLRGKRLERIPGADLAVDIFLLSAQKGYRVLLFGGKPGVARKAKMKLIEKYKNIHVVGAIDGVRVNADRETPEFVSRINESKPDIVLVGLGAPKQDMWINRNLDLISANVFVGVGGTLDFISGQIPRAPLFFRRFSLEWLFRLFVEPRRFKRIFNAVVVFPFLVILHKIRVM